MGREGGRPRIPSWHHRSTNDASFKLFDDLPPFSSFHPFRRAGLQEEILPKSQERAPRLEAQSWGGGGASQRDRPGEVGSRQQKMGKPPGFSVSGRGKKGDRERSGCPCSARFERQRESPFVTSRDRMEGVCVCVRVVEERETKPKGAGEGRSADRIGSGAAAPFSVCAPERLPGGMELSTCARLGSSPSQTPACSRPLPSIASERSTEGRWPEPPSSSVRSSPAAASRRPILRGSRTFVRTGGGGYLARRLQAWGHASPSLPPSPAPTYVSHRTCWRCCPGRCSAAPASLSSPAWRRHHRHPPSPTAAAPPGRRAGGGSGRAGGRRD